MISGVRLPRTVGRSYAAKLSLSLLAIVALIVASGALVYVEVIQEFGEADAGIASSILGLILVSVISLALLGVTIGSNTVISLRHLSGKAQKMADGDLSIGLETPRDDELGELYASFDEMRRSLRDQIETAEQATAETEKARAEIERRADALEATAESYERVMRSVADGDLTARVDPDVDSVAMANVGRAFNTMLDELEATVGDVQRFADHVGTAGKGVDDRSEELKVASNDVAAAIDQIEGGAVEQSDKLREVSEEINTLSASSEEVAATVESVAKTTESATEAGSDGQQAAEAAIDQMGAIEARTERTMGDVEALDEEMGEIGEIVGLITDIAEQTNLLALNASIEAARAEQGGDGFAVVADEVKSLAEETKAAAGEIEDRIERIKDRTGDAVEGMEETSERITEGATTVEDAIDELNDVIEYVEEIDDSVQEINQATDEQADSTASVVGMIETVASIAEETATAADEVADTTDTQLETLERVERAATELSGQAGRLESTLDRFETDRNGAVAEVGDGTNTIAGGGAHGTALTKEDVRAPTIEATEGDQR